MKKFALLCLISAGLWACQQQDVPTEISQILDKVREAHAPDKRVAIWEVEATPSTDGLQFSGETNLPEALEELKAKIAETGLEAHYDIQLLPSPDLEGKTYGIVNLSACNIRSEPRHSGELSTQSTLGTILKVYKKDNGWYLVQTPDGYLGWLDSAGFVPADEASIKAWKDSDKVIYLPDFGFSYAAPSEEAPKVSDLIAGNILQLKSYQNTYARVAYPDGREAYIPEAQVMEYKQWLATAEATPENILATAEQFLGRPYLWGGTSGKGVDCSGFTKTVFYLNGLMLPRDASQQVYVGQPVETDTTLKNLQAGDLLFFGRKAEENKKEKITHVAIYMGDGKIIHSSGQVRIESMLRGDSTFNEYRLESFVRAKRMLPAQAQQGVYPLEELEAY